MFAQTGNMAVNSKHVCRVCKMTFKITEMTFRITSAATIIPTVGCSNSNYLKIRPSDFLVIKLCYASRPNTLKSCISQRFIVASLRTRAFHTHFSRAEIKGCDWASSFSLSNVDTESNLRTTCRRALEFCVRPCFFLASTFEIGKWIFRLISSSSIDFVLQMFNFPHLSIHEEVLLVNG